MDEFNMNSLTDAAGGNILPLLRPSSRHSVWTGANVEARTGPFERLRGRSVLVALDLENIDRSAANIGRVVDYVRLARALREGIGRNTHLIAIFSRDDNETTAEHFLWEAGWMTYTRPIDVVRNKFGIVKHGNADVAFATVVGAAVTSLEADACVLGTGDGQLAIDVARCVKAIAPSCKTSATLSLPGSTSQRLDARRSDIFAVNLEIGDDVMNRLAIPTDGGRPAAPTPAVNAVPAMAYLSDPAALV